MAYIYNFTDTWNAAGTVFNGIKLNVTNTASATGSKLMDLQLAGATFFNVDKSGSVGINVAAPAARLHVSDTTTIPVIVQNASAATTYIRFINSGANAGYIGYSGTSILVLTGGVERFSIDANGNVIINTAAVATNATNGFLYVPGCTGTPTGVPTTVTGRVPIVVDTTNNKLYFYSGGAWRDAGP